MTEVTILGSSGFIGSHLLRAFRSSGVSCYTPSRAEPLTHRPLGQVFYCIGLTSDFRTRPFDTVAAHVCRLREVLEGCEFERLVYLSSTRVYGRCEGRPDEEAVLPVSSADPSDLYNISKLMGESLALSAGRPCQVVRLSNVYGRDAHSSNFLTSVVRDAVLTGSVVLRTALSSEKDYIHVDQAVTLLMKIAAHGRHRVYNVASGVNTSNAALMECLARQTGAAVTVLPDAPAVLFPALDVRRIREEFGAVASDVTGDIQDLVRFVADGGDA